ncbi:hypothetical protein TRVL_01752 [Trypanosoma vivax]|uniref:Uncharacterized protein n=1 Tax=Trypanosoma vivax (strain Y486) TaxID=1055687 RepID=G0U0V2_TRYVY|nr:hypothetical protein TRVL_01752 [Trypanosoma vivax]CCC49705.1 hypothetical protein, conserved in T. vivax [Trypanosoma vivax Y486]
MHEERQHIRARYAAADGENNDLKQWICQSEGQIQHKLERIKRLQKTNGVLAAECGLFKSGRFRSATEMRGASAQRSEPNAQLQRQWPGTVFHAPTTGERQQPQENNAPPTTNVGLLGIQVLRDKLSVGPFKPEETIRTHEATLDSEKIPQPYGVPARIVKRGTLCTQPRR